MTLKRYKIKFKGPAKADKTAIKEYLRQFYPSTPGKFLQKLSVCVENIKTMPGMYPFYEADRSYRKALVDQYLVFYKVVEEANLVEIHRIIHGSRDLTSIIIS